jgi:FkbM family methyltransferase
MSWRTHVYPVLGQALHAMGAPNWGAFRQERGASTLIDHCWAYMHSYYEGRNRVEGPLYLPEVDAWVYCDFRDWLIRPYIGREKPIYEWNFISHVRSLCQPGDVIFDIGANHGYWAVSLGSAVGPSGQVITVEPNPELSSRLARTARLNRKKIRMVVVPKAVTDGSTDKIRFYVPTLNNSGTGSTVLHAYAAEHGYLDATRSIEVDCISMDRLVNELGVHRIDIVKVDIEFGEDAFVRGALSALRKYRPREIICETAKNSYAYSALAAMGYAPYLLDDLGSASSLIDDAYWGNVFFRRVD